MPEERHVCLAIDTASDTAGIAIVEHGAILGEVTWQARQSHSRQLLPAVDWLLGQVGRSKEQVGAIFVCTGPGSYAGMRVGISTAKALSFALGTSVIGIGRLAAEALPIVEATGARVVPVQAAGRAELAWAAYAPRAGDMLEVEAPQLAPVDTLLRALKFGDVITGDVDRLTPETLAAFEVIGCRVVPPSPSRITAVARLGHRRLQAGDADDADELVPLYLRAPAIGPQPPLPANP
jgi:tRNA threonylcarbamoyladenosine biosynthesis protein TsaB